MRSFRFALSEFRHSEMYLAMHAKKAVSLALEDPPNHLKQTLQELKEIPRSTALAAISPEFVAFLRTPEQNLSSNHEPFLRYLGVPIYISVSLDTCTTEVLITHAKNPDLSSQAIQILLTRDMTTAQLSEALSCMPNSVELLDRLLVSEEPLDSFDGFVHLLSAYVNSERLYIDLRERLSKEFNQLMNSEAALTVQNLVDCMELISNDRLVSIFELGKTITTLALKQLGAMNSKQLISSLNSIQNMGHFYTFTKNHGHYSEVIDSINSLGGDLQVVCKIVNQLSRLGVKNLPYHIVLYIKQLMESKVKSADFSALIEAFEAIALWQIHNTKFSDRIVARCQDLLAERFGHAHKPNEIDQKTKLALFKFMKVLGENEKPVPPLLVEKALQVIPGCNHDEILSCLSSCITIQNQEVIAAAFNVAQQLVPNLPIKGVIDLLMFIDKLDSQSKATPESLIAAVAARLLELKDNWDASSIGLIAHRFSFKSLNLNIHEVICTTLFEANAPTLISQELQPEAYHYKDGDRYIYPQNQIINQLSVKSAVFLINSLLQSRQLPRDLRDILNLYTHCLLSENSLEIPLKNLINLGDSLSARENFDRDLVKLFIETINTHEEIDFIFADNWKRVGGCWKVLPIYIYIWLPVHW